MGSILILWFKGLKKSTRLFFVVLSLVLLAFTIQSARLARSEYLRLKAVEKAYKEASEKVDISEKKEAEIIKKSKVFTEKTLDKNKTINEKLKQDEKYINDSSVSDDEIRAFISKHKKR